MTTKTTAKAAYRTLGRDFSDIRSAIAAVRAYLKAASAGTTVWIADLNTGQSYPNCNYSARQMPQIRQTTIDDLA